MKTAVLTELAATSGNGHSLPDVFEIRTKTCRFCRHMSRILPESHDEYTGVCTLPGLPPVEVRDESTCGFFEESGW